MVKSLPANAGNARDMGVIPGLGRSPGGGNGNSLQYSCLENSMDRRGDTVHGVTKSQTQLHFLFFLSTGIPSPPLALFVVVLPKAQLALHSRMSGSR